jgi:hypothetical protein
VPWLWLDDESRTPIFNPTWDSLTEWATTAVRWTRLNPWKGRPPKTLTESRAVAGILRNLADQYCFDVFPTGGQCGGWLRTVVAPELVPGDRVLYAGDLDLSGGQIEANTRAVLERRIGGELNWTRIALTETQVDQYDLRQWAITKFDRRYKPPRQHQAIECEALKQHIIVDVVRDQLNALLPEPLEDVLEREARQRRRLITAPNASSRVAGVAPGADISEIQRGTCLNIAMKDVTMREVFAGGHDDAPPSFRFRTKRACARVRW